MRAPDPTQQRGRARRRLVALVALVALLAGACTGGGPDAAAPPASAPGEPGAVTAASDRAAPAMHASLRVELALRSLLVRELAALAPDDETAPAVTVALQGRRDEVVSVLEGAGALEGTDDLRAALASEDQLLVAASSADDLVGRLRIRAARPAVQQAVARALALVSAGRLPLDVAEPLAEAHLRALLDLADAAGTVAEPAATVASAAATARLAEPLALAVAAELDLDGDVRGDAAALLVELASVLAGDGFARATVALGSDGATGRSALASQRLRAVVQRLYGEEVAQLVDSSWRETRLAAEGLLDALRARYLARERGSAAVIQERAVARARDRHGAAVASLASQLAGTVGAREVAPAVRAALEQHRIAIEGLHEPGQPTTRAASWRDAAAVGAELASLAPVLTNAIVLQKSMG